MIVIRYTLLSRLPYHATLLTSFTTHHPGACLQYQLPPLYPIAEISERSTVSSRSTALSVATYTRSSSNASSGQVSYVSAVSSEYATCHALPLVPEDESITNCTADSSTSTQGLARPHQHQRHQHQQQQTTMLHDDAAPADMSVRGLGQPPPGYPVVDAAGPPPAGYPVTANDQNAAVSNNRSTPAGQSSFVRSMVTKFQAVTLHPSHVASSRQLPREAGDMTQQKLAAGQQLQQTQEEVKATRPYQHHVTFSEDVADYDGASCTHEAADLSVTAVSGAAIAAVVPAFDAIAIEDSPFAVTAAVATQKLQQTAVQVQAVQAVFNCATAASAAATTTVTKTPSFGRPAKLADSPFACGPAGFADDDDDNHETTAPPGLLLLQADGPPANGTGAAVHMQPTTAAFGNPAALEDSPFASPGDFESAFHHDGPAALADSAFAFAGGADYDDENDYNDGLYDEFAVNEGIGGVTDQVVAADTKASSFMVGGSDENVWLDPPAAAVAEGSTSSQESPFVRYAATTANTATTPAQQTTMVLDSQARRNSGLATHSTAATTTTTNTNTTFALSAITTAGVSANTQRTASTASTQSTSNSGRGTHVEALPAGVIAIQTVEAVATVKAATIKTGGSTPTRR